MAQHQKKLTSLLHTVPPVYKLALFGGLSLRPDQYMVMEDKGVVNTLTSEMRNTPQTPTAEMKNTLCKLLLQKWETLQIPTSEMKNTANTYFGNEKLCKHLLHKWETLCKHLLQKWKILQMPTLEIRNTLQIPTSEMRNIPQTVLVETFRKLFLFSSGREIAFLSKCAVSCTPQQPMLIFMAGFHAEV